jgi:hypothetical protein
MVTLLAARHTVNRFVSRKGEALARFRLNSRGDMPSRNSITVSRSRRAPTVEIDTSLGTAYVRFESGNIRSARSERIDRPGYPTVTMDFDKKGDLVGVGLQGVMEFNVVRLLELAQIQAPDADLNHARYVGAGNIERQMVA